MKQFGKYLFLVLLFSYGLFYMSYKYGQPGLANRDFFKYEKMVDSPLNFRIAPAPVVTRQIPVLTAFLLKKVHVFYSSHISYQDGEKNFNYNSQVDFFTLILSNYLAFLFSIALILNFLADFYGSEINNVVFQILALTLGYFMTPLSIISPLTQGWGWLVVTLITLSLIKNNYLIGVAGIFVALFARETVPVFFIVFIISFLVINRAQIKNYPFLLRILGILGLSVIFLLVIRHLFTYGNEYQLTPWGLLRRTFTIRHPGEYFFQGFLTQGVLCYAVVRLFQKSKAIAYPCLVAQLVMILISAHTGGRITSESFPFVLLLLFTPIEKLAEAFHLPSFSARLLEKSIS